MTMTSAEQTKQIDSAQDHTDNAFSGPADKHPGWQRLKESLANARKLWRDFTGESAYDKYVERHHRLHPDHEPMSEREFWRARAKFDEQNVKTGCC